MAAMEQEREDKGSGMKSPKFSVSVREAKPDDAEALGVICFNAFKTFNDSVGIDYTMDFTSVGMATEFMRSCVEGPEKAYCGIVAVDDETGQLLGSGYLHNSDSDIYSIGPVSVDPDRSSQGVGRLIMSAMIDKAKQDGATSLRLIQVAPNTRSFALYASLGFVARDCFAVFWAALEPAQAAAAASALGFAPSPDAVVRLMEEADVGACSSLFKEVNGYSRSAGIRRSVGPSAWVATSKSGEILGYTAGFTTMFGHSLAKSENDFMTLILGVASKAQIKFFLTISPSRYPKLAQWAFAAKLRLMRNNWYMVIGDYQAPKGDCVYCPNIKH